MASHGQPKRSLMFNLGAFVGHIVRGVKADPRAPQGQGGAGGVVREEVRQEVRETPQGRVTLRRTVVEEVRIDPLEPRQGAG